MKTFLLVCVMCASTITTFADNWVIQKFDPGRSGTAPNQQLVPPLVFVTTLAAPGNGTTVEYSSSVVLDSTNLPSIADGAFLGMATNKFVGLSAFPVSPLLAPNQGCARNMSVNSI